MWQAKDRRTGKSWRILLGRYSYGRLSCICATSEWNGTAICLNIPFRFLKTSCRFTSSTSHMFQYKQHGCISERLKILCFHQGLWLGIVCGSLSKLILLFWITMSINWEKEVSYLRMPTILYQGSYQFSFHCKMCHMLMFAISFQSTRAKELVFSSSLPVA